ncbi:hypothetical protein N9769_06810 [Ascidiaceihabitans sp.]|nr:hypothetical protein [Ascidiaceihabitans sp.]HCI05868.1 hypothetical protein [Sulfitobacter sp.]
MNQLLIIIALMVPCISALLLSRITLNPHATKLLFWGGASFLFVIFLSVMLDQQCRGSLVTNWVECRPAMLLGLANTFSKPLLVSLMAYIFIGPFMVIAAGVFELLHRRRTS